MGITKEEWVSLLSAHQLQLIDGIDISQETANYLHDPEFSEHLAEIEATEIEATEIEATEIEATEIETTESTRNGLDPNIKSGNYMNNVLALSKLMPN